MAETMPLLLLLLLPLCFGSAAAQNRYHRLHPSRYINSPTGPPDPRWDAGIQAIVNRRKNIVVGGPFDDYTGGDQDWNKVVYHFGRGGQDLMDVQKGNDVVFGGDGIDALYGEDGDDSLIGGPGNDHLIGGPGSDKIWGGPGNDHINGDTCSPPSNTCQSNGKHIVTWDDHIQGGPGDDSINGFQGRDEIYGDEGNDFVRAGADDDAVFGDAGDDTIYGDDGNDFIFGGAGNDVILGGNGDDILYGGPGSDKIETGSGKDTVYVDAFPCGATDVVTMNVAEGDRLLIIAPFLSQVYQLGYRRLTIKEIPRTHYVGVYVAGCNTPIAQLGASSRVPIRTLTSSVIGFVTAPPRPPAWLKGRLPEPVPGRGGVPHIPPANVMIGTNASDILRGAHGGPYWTNYMFGNAMFDYLVGGPGGDVLIGGNHHDTLYGGDGDDLLSGDGWWGVGGNDVLWGEGGNDALFGGHGMDHLYGGPGKNWLTGGDRGDHFYVDVDRVCHRTETDIIVDFSGPESRADFGQDTLYVVGSLTSIDQLMIIPARTLTHVYVKGCSIPFVTVLFVGNNRNGKSVPLSEANVKFITQDKIWRIDSGRRGGDFINVLTNNTAIYFNPGYARGNPPTPTTNWPPPGTKPVR